MAIPGITAADTVPSERSLLEAVLSAVRSYLPASWSVTSTPPVRRLPDLGVDALWDIRAPDNSAATLLVSVIRQAEPKQIELIVSRWKGSDQQGRLFVVSAFLSPRSRELLKKADACYGDATGNLRIHLEAPAVFVQLEGATTDPWRASRPVLSLKGPAAGRVVRALCDFQPPYGILELAGGAHTPAASVSRIVDLVDREGLLRRAPRGAVLDVKVPDLIRRWTQDYGLSRSNTISAVLEPRGLDALLKKLKGVDWPYAVTGTLAARTVAPYAAARLGVVYVQQSAQAAVHLGLRPVDAGANVLLATPFDPVVFDRTKTVEGVTYAALSQVAADLLTSPGRGPAEGEELLQWMEEHEHEWRH
jgi:hypothetical protein